MATRVNPRVVAFAALRPKLYGQPNPQSVTRFRIKKIKDDVIYGYTYMCIDVYI